MLFGFVRILLCTALLYANTLTTYTLSGAHDYTGASGPYTTSMSISGSFTTSSPLADDLSYANIGSNLGFRGVGQPDGILTDFSFSDGVYEWNVFDANSSLDYLTINTNAQGQITDWA